MFFTCDHGLPYLHYCAHQLEFNDDLNVCDHAANAGCVADPTLECGAPISTTPTTITTSATTTPITSTTSISTTSTTTTLESDCVPECPTPNAIYGDPRDCHHFFQCVDSIPYERKCREGWEFSSELQGCTTPELAGCTADPDAPCVAGTITHPSEITTVETTTEEVLETTSDQLTTVEDCVPYCPSPNAIFGDPRDCHHFYQCVDGIIYERECREGWEYSTELQGCTTPELAGCTADPDAPCVGGSTSPSNEITTEEATTEEATTEEVLETTTDQPTTVEDCVPYCPSPNAIFGDPRDCHHFYQCVGGILYERECREGWEYSTELQGCTTPELAGCTADPDAPCVAGSTSPSNEITTEEATTEEATTEEATTEEATTEEVLETTTVEDCVPYCPSPNAIFGDPRDCHHFYQCFDGILYERECREGWEYSTELQGCTTPELAGCTADPDAPCVGGSTSPSNEITTEEATTEEATTEEVLETTTDQPTTVEDCILYCPSPNAIFGDPRDCHHFYQCVDGILHERECREGWEYSTELQGCTTPELAGCIATPDAPCVPITQDLDFKLY